jgi:glycosyltransferase involved in cell wall biosynthesis
MRVVEMAALSGKRICIVMAGHLATSPRMTKVADALSDAGCRIRVVSTRSTLWADVADVDLASRRKGKWTWDTVDYRESSTGTYVFSGARQRFARFMARRRGPASISVYLAACARDRVFPELVSKATTTPADMIYGGGGSLAATAFAARRMGVPYAIDLEDFHSAEHANTPEGRFIHSLTERIEGDLLPGAALRTGGSQDISNAYREKYSLDVETINNTFPLDESARAGNRGSGPLRMYWFSQTIGPGRGIEDAIRAAGCTGVPMELHLQGRSVPDYVASLHDLRAQCAPSLELIEHAPGLPDEMLLMCSQYDVGLSLELNEIRNRSLSLTNKALAYVAAGMAVVLTNTVGQRRLAADLQEGAFLYEPGDVSSLAGALRGWSLDRQSLLSAQAATRAAAERRWNWNHAAERGRLIEAVARIL